MVLLEINRGKQEPMAFQKKTLQEISFLLAKTDIRIEDFNFILINITYFSINNNKLRIYKYFFYSLEYFIAKKPFIQ
jgi:hypothetical protein